MRSTALGAGIALVSLAIAACGGSSTSPAAADAGDDAGPYLHALPPCRTSADCAGHTYCGYSTALSCDQWRGSTGQCIGVAPCDGGDCVAGIGCGCDGRPVPYVSAGEASAPIATLTPCAAARDAGAD